MRNLNELCLLVLSRIWLGSTVVFSSIFPGCVITMPLTQYFENDDDADMVLAILGVAISVVFWQCLKHFDLGSRIIDACLKPGRYRRPF